VTTRVFRNEREAAAAVADGLASAVARDPAIVLGFATGRTPLPLYARLADLHGQGRLDCSRVTTFNLDEFWRLPSSHPGSYRAYMDRHVFSRLGIAARQVRFLDGMAADPERECQRYEDEIRSAGGLGVQILGIGANGHIGFNEPGSALSAHTHLATLMAQTRRANAVFFSGDAAQVPAQALSMGMGTILSARRVILIAMGRGKARAVQSMVQGPLTTRLPASFLQLHPAVDVVLDEAAAERLASSRGEPA
jgi:glucosamine-6-phosphate deaminase